MSVTSILSIIFFSGISLGLIHFIMMRNQFLAKIGARFLIICMLLIGLRLFIPVELPFARSIYINKVLPDVYLFLIHPISFLNNINLLSVFAYIWLLGSLVFFAKSAYAYVKLLINIKNFECVSEQKFDNIISDITSCYKRKVHFRLARTDKVSVPIVSGIFKPTIIIPDIELTNQEWSFVFKHEIAHFYQRDLLYRFACEILHVIYWWNPIIIMLKTQMANLQEVNIDKKVTENMDDLETTDYLLCLIKISHLVEEKRNPELVAAFYSKYSFAASDRINLVWDSKLLKKRESVVSLAIMLFLALVTMVLPNCLIMEPYGVADEVGKESVRLKDLDTYLILNEDNTYDLYIDNEYKLTLNEVFDESIPIYRSREEVKNVD